MKIFSIKTAESHPIKISLAFIGVALLATWSFYRPYVIEDLSADFTTKIEMRNHVIAQNVQVAGTNTRLDGIDTKLETMLAKDMRGEAYTIIANIEGDIERHKKIENNNPAWIETDKQLNARLETAIQYRDCVMKNGFNCLAIKDRIWL